MMTSHCYAYNLNKLTTNQQITQPKPEDRLFLNRPPPRTIYSCTHMRPTYKFSVQQLPIEKVIPRCPILDINLAALQTWINHLGEAIYNPIEVAYVNNEYIIHLDGDHRTRCLWELGISTVAVFLRESNQLKMDSQELQDYRAWLKKASALNCVAPRIKRFYGKRVSRDVACAWKRYYPPLHPPSATLCNFYPEKHDGQYLERYLDSPMTFRQIYGKNKHLPYRFYILNKILEYTNPHNKLILDVGCFYGWLSFLLAEAGADVVALDTNQNRVDVVEAISERRAYHHFVHALHCSALELEEIPEFDAALLLNVFHHILSQDKEKGWRFLQELCQKTPHVFIMMDNTLFDVLSEFNNNVKDALTSMLPDKQIVDLGKPGYRNRTLYLLC